jgi:hypothetical protein
MKLNKKVLLLAGTGLVILVILIAVVGFFQKQAREQYIKDNGIVTTSEIKEAIPYQTKTIELKYFPSDFEFSFPGGKYTSGSGMDGTKTYSYQTIIDKNTREIIEKKLIKEEITKDPVNETIVIGKAKITNTDEFENSEIYKFASSCADAYNNNDRESFYNYLYPGSEIKTVLNKEDFVSTNTYFKNYHKYSIDKVDYLLSGGIFSYYDSFSDHLESELRPYIRKVNGNTYISLKMFINLDVILPVNEDKIYCDVSGFDFATKFYISPKQKIPDLDGKDPDADYQLALYQSFYFNNLKLNYYLIKNDNSISGSYPYFLGAEYVFNDNSTKPLISNMPIGMNIQNLNHIKIYYKIEEGKEIFSFNINDFQPLFDNQAKLTNSN